MAVHTPELQDTGQDYTGTTRVEESQEPRATSTIRTTKTRITSEPVLININIIIDILLPKM